MRETDAKNTEAQRTRIVEAAARCLTRSGVARTSISDICREAGMRSGHIYYYFENKDALLEAVLLIGQDQVVKSIEALAESEDIAASILEIHVEAEQRRLSSGLTPLVRIELECYFHRSQTSISARHDHLARTTSAVRAAVCASVDAKRLPEHIDIDSYADAIVLVWEGLSLSRLDQEFDLKAKREAVRLLLTVG